MSTAPSSIDDIRRKMAQIRRDLHDDVKNVVEGAEAATDWRRFIRHYPWASMGVAMAVGYMVVPRKHRPITTIQAAPAEIARALAIEPARLATPEPKKKGKGLLGTLIGMAAPVAFRAAQGYALKYAEQWMTQKVAEQAQQNPHLAAALSGFASAQAGPGTETRATPPGSGRFPG